MSARKKTKLCWHCHGTVPAEVTHCAYCGEQCEPQKSEAPPYFPPYTGGDTHAHSSREEDHAGHAKSHEKTREFPFLLVHTLKQMLHKCNSAWGFSALIPSLLMGWGVFFAGLSLIFLAFSTNGRLHLEFNAGRWWLHLIFALAMIWGSALWRGECEGDDEPRDD